MQCFAQCDWSSSTRSLQLLPDTTVRQVKNAVAHSFGEAETWLEYQGHHLEDGAQLQQAGVGDGSCVHLHLRLQGGGGDGGSTGAESRSCFLEMYSSRKAAKVNPIEEKLARWTQCQLSGEPLQQPVVADQLGFLFNKDAVIQALLKKSMPKALGHITSLKQLTELKLTPAPEGGSKPVDSTSFQPGNDAPFICPITEVPLNGRFRAFVLRPSGLVVSERAVKEMPQLVRERAGGVQMLEASSMLPLNGSIDEVNQLMDEVMAAHTARTAAKASKKSKNGGLKPSQAPLSSQPAALDAEQKAGIALAAANAAEAELRLTSATAAKDLKAAISTFPKKHARSEPLMQTSAAGIAEAVSNMLGSHAAKKYKAAEHIPDGANKSVYSSIFIGDRRPAKETYSCRATSARGMNMT
ncbi:hypothetical protein WJX74_007036 [Apatococcus lobatus]|uniref:Ubiquitin-like domain-containing protein n=1 Tax=Apatococcus lobatus TaxID=904363 RepID=A0AAW1SH20_9CHLO